MDLTPTIAPAIATAIANVKAMIPADITAAHDALADLESKLLAGGSTDLNQLLIIASQNLTTVLAPFAALVPVISLLLSGKKRVIITLEDV